MFEVGVIRDARFVQTVALLYQIRTRARKPHHLRIVNCPVWHCALSVLISVGLFEGRSKFMAVYVILL